MHDYESCDAVALAQRVERGEVSPEELLDAALERLARWNPVLGAVHRPLEAEARKTLASELPRGPLRGVPFLLKDLHAHYAGVPTTNGSRLFADFVPDHDAEVVIRYKAAGLVIFGKTATPEFGLTTTTESALFGATRNPWNLERTSGGSSGGAAAAVAAGIVPAANASDGGGSIRIPAACCGLFGLKPGRGRVPAGPDAGEGWSGMSTVHAVSRSVRDSAALLDAVRGPDLGAPYWAPSPERPYLEEVSRDPGRLRIALQIRSFNGAPTHPDCASAARGAAELLRGLGHEVEEAEVEFDREGLAAAARVIIFANLRATVRDRLAALGRELAPDDLEPFTARMYEAIADADAADYARSIRGIHAAGRRVEAFLQRYDALLTPTMASPPMPIGALSLSHPNVGDYVRNVLQTTGFTQLFNASGHPAMSVPLHWNEEGLPIGVQIAGRMADEATLFRLAAQLESAQPWSGRRPPEPPPQSPRA